MGNFTTVPDVVVDQSFPPSLWESAIMNNLNLGVCRQLADHTCVGAEASIDFSSLPATFAHLLVFILARGDIAATQTSLNLQFNGDSGHYDWFSGLSGGSGSASAATSGQIGFMSGSTAPANKFSPYVLWIPHYAQASTQKGVQTLGFNTPGTGGANVDPYVNSIMWTAAAAAINEITFLPGSGNFVANSRFTVYGLPA